MCKCVVTIYTYVHVCLSQSPTDKPFAAGDCSGSHMLAGRCESVNRKCRGCCCLGCYNNDIFILYLLSQSGVGLFILDNNAYFSRQIPEYYPI